MIQRLSALLLCAPLLALPACDKGNTPVVPATAQPSPAPAPTGAPPAQVKQFQDQAAVNWQPTKAVYKAAETALVKTADVIKQGKTQRPNFLIIWGDDIGGFNISAYNMGMMSYKTPNIDRIAQEGMLFTDSYGENSCTAGRAAFITGQLPVRTGLTKVGLPGATLGLQAEDVTIAELLKPLGYVTGQFGKNHLGDLDEHLPTAHGFDEFYGNLYHLNAEEEPENVNYPKDPRMKELFGPRGVMHSKADGEIKDTGPLTRKRMETVDQDVTARAMEFMENAVKAKKPFFLWWNSTRMHIFTHLKPESEGVTGQGIFADGMVEHDGHVGQLLDKVDALGIADNTIVMYSTDNGAETFSWPDGGTTMFRGEKNTTWEGGFRVPTLVRWPGKIPAGVVSNGIISHIDWLPTMLAAAGEPNVKAELLKGKKVGAKTFKVHLDGYNQLDLFLGNGPSARKQIFYFTDGGNLSAVRINDWKVMFSEQRAHGLAVWEEPFVELRFPKLMNLRMDPFERAEYEAIGYSRWRTERMFALYPSQWVVGDLMKSFKDFPPRQRPASFSVDQIMSKLYQGNR